MDYRPCPEPGPAGPVADADRTNQTLAAFFGDLVISPPSAADDDMRP
jgi:hypothetical protein